MIVVLDASAAIEVIHQRGSVEVLTQSLSMAEWVISPYLFVSEVTNVFWKYQKMADYSFEDCEKNIEQALALPDDFISDFDLHKEAFNMSCMLNHPVYDMLYMILARRHSATLLTMDKKLKKACKKSGVKFA